MWERAVTQVDALDRLREWLDRQAEKGKAVEKQRVAAADLDMDRVNEFVESSVQAFGRNALLRRYLLDLDAVEVKPPSGDPIFRRSGLEPKDLFLTGGPLRFDDGAIGKLAATDLDEAVYRTLSEHSGAGEDGPDAVEAALNTMRRMVAEGFHPNLVLVPSTIWARPALARHPSFAWRAPPVVHEPGPIGSIDDVPVYDVGPDGSEHMLILDAARAVRLIEHRRGGSRSPLEISVESITSQRAEALVDQGFSFADQPDWSSGEIVRELCDRFVEIRAELDYSLAPQPRASEAARSVPLPTRKRKS